MPLSPNLTTLRVLAKNLKTIPYMLHTHTHYMDPRPWSKIRPSPIRKSPFMPVYREEFIFLSLPCMPCKILDSHKAAKINPRHLAPSILYPRTPFPGTAQKKSPVMRLDPAREKREKVRFFSFSRVLKWTMKVWRELVRQAERRIVFPLGE